MGKHSKTEELEQSCEIHTQRRIMFSLLLVYIFLERFAQLNPDLAKSLPYREIRKSLYDRNAPFRVVEMIHHGNFEGAHALLVKTFPELMKGYEPMLTRLSVFLTLAWQGAKTDNPNIPDIEYPELTPNND